MTNQEALDNIKKIILSQFNHSEGVSFKEFTILQQAIDDLELLRLKNE